VNLYAYSALGCSDTASVVISYQEGIIYYIPNTFTPDGDNHNQIFKPIFISGYDPNNFNMSVYNRWGEVVFETKNSDIGWDGSYGIEGTDAPSGIYTYNIIYKIPTNDERKIVNGHVYLLR
jgi:gliding motility-associated-like protein